MDEVAWLTKGLERWDLEFGWRTRLLIWVTRQLHRLGLIEMDDVKAVVERVVNDGLKREFSDAGLRVLRLITGSEMPGMQEGKSKCKLEDVTLSGYTIESH